MYYCTLQELKDRMDITATDTDDDAKLQSMLEAISRQIDKQMRRRFYVTSSDETRYYSSVDPNTMFPDDIVSITTLKTDTNGDGTYNETWATTDYYLMPLNAALDDEPYTKIQTATLGTKRFPVLPNDTQIVGKFGWPEVPDQIREATLLISQRLFFRKDAVFGIVKGARELGEVRRIIIEDPEVQNLLHGMDKKGRLV